MCDFLRGKSLQFGRSNNIYRKSGSVYTNCETAVAPNFAGDVDHKLQLRSLFFHEW